MTPIEPPEPDSGNDDFASLLKTGAVFLLLPLAAVGVGLIVYGNTWPEDRGQNGALLAFNEGALWWLLGLGMLVVSGIPLFLFISVESADAYGDLEQEQADSTRSKREAWRRITLESAQASESLKEKKQAEDRRRRKKQRSKRSKRGW